MTAEGRGGVAGYDLSHAAWRRSSYSGQNGDCVEFAIIAGGPDWRTSSHSGQSGACVQVAPGLPELVGVRDSKDPGGPVLTFTPQDWRSFTEQVKGGQDWLG
jgi:Domain of unknown function (DUF397)